VFSLSIHNQRNNIQDWWLKINSAVVLVGCDLAFAGGLLGGLSHKGHDAVGIVANSAQPRINSLRVISKAYSLHREKLLYLSAKMYQRAQI